MKISLGKRVLESLVLRAIGVIFLFLMHAVLGKTLGVHDYGVFSYVIATSMLIATFAPLGWHILNMRFIPEYSVKNEWSYMKGLISLSNRLTIFIAILTSFMLVILTKFDLLFVEKESLVIYIAILIPLMALSTLRRRMFVGFSNVRGSLVPEEILLPGLMTFSMVFLPIIREYPIQVYIASYLMITVFAIFWLQSAYPSELKSSKPDYETKKWFTISLPLLVTAGSQMALNQSGIIILGIASSYEDVGVYSIAFRVSLLVTFTMTAVNTIGAPSLARTYHANNITEFWSIYRKTTKWGVIGGVMVFIPIFLFPYDVLSVFGDEFTSGGMLLRILLLGQLANVLVGLAGSALVVVGQERIFAGLLLLICLFQYIAGYVASVSNGAFGMSIVTAVSLVALNFLSLYYVIKMIKLDPVSELPN